MIVFVVAAVLGVGVLAALWFAWEPLFPFIAWLVSMDWFFVVEAILLGITAMALMLTIDHTLNGIWRVRRARPITQRVLVYWAALTLGPLLVGASLWMTSYVLSASRGLVDELPGGVGLLLSLIVFALQTAGFAALYRYVPNTRVVWAHAWVGGVFAALVFSTSVVSIPMILDRDTDALTAAITSIASVRPR